MEVEDLKLSEPGDWVELVDENQPNGLVVFKRADGSPFMWMPRSDYENLLKAR